MADFVAHFGETNVHDTFAQLETIAHDNLRYYDLSAQRQDDWQLLLMDGSHLQFYNGESGWIVTKGIICDPGISLKPTPESILNDITNNAHALNRYEGAFCLAAWDKRRKIGFGLNDQSGMLNLYFLECYRGIFIASNALLLAKAAGLGLSPQGVAEFLARGTLLAPRTMFNGLLRLNVGEHLLFQAGRSTISRHWHAFADRVMNPSEVVEKLSQTIVERVSTLAQDHQAVLCDLTGGYDSRLVVASAMQARLPISVTVNGPATLPDVLVAHAVAREAQLDIHHFDVATFWDRDIDQDLRRELVWRTSGELRFVQIYHHFLSRPLLAQTYSLHMIGSGGELLRYFPWSQEFLGIGRRRPANVDRAMTYRFLHAPVPQHLARGDWWPWYRIQLLKDIQAVCKQVPGARTTEQLDAVYVWKMTSHSTAYLTSLFNWLPSVAPLLTAGVIKASVSVPWQMKLTSALQRRLIQQLSPRIAKCRTVYGATAEPPNMRTVHLEALQLAKQAQHFAKKIEKVVLRGALSRRSKTALASEWVYPFWSDDFVEMLDPKTMKSRALYSSEHLLKLIAARPTSGREADQLLTIATIEQLCQELRVELDGQFFKDLPA